MNEKTKEEREMLDNLPEPHRTKVSANYTANKLMGRNQIFKHLEKKVDYYQQEKIRDEAKAFLNNGGEGIDLTFDEACMIFGIARIFTKYDYPNNVEFPKKELYRALNYDNNLSGWQRQRIKRTLEHLAEKRVPIYWTERDGYRWLTFDTLIKLAWGIETEEGGIEFESSPTRQNFTRYKLALNKRLFGNIPRNFRLANPEIGREIREYRKNRGERSSKYDIRLYDLLLGENKSPIKRNYLKIAQAPMLMDHYIRERKLSIIREKLNSIYQMYTDIGYLKHVEIDQKGSKKDIDILYLNPERFYQLRGNKDDK